MSTRRTGSSLVGDPVSESTCGSWTSQERKWEPGILVNWWLGARMSCTVIGIIRKQLHLRSETGCFVRGDVGHRDAGGYFYILDRVKDMIVTGGENVYSGEVEAVIYEHSAVLEAAVFGIPDPQWGELVAACVVRKPGRTLSADELIAHCRRFLATYK